MCNYFWLASVFIAYPILVFAFSFGRSIGWKSPLFFLGLSVCLVLIQVGTGSADFVGALCFNGEHRGRAYLALTYAATLASITVIIYRSTLEKKGDSSERKV